MPLLRGAAAILLLALAGGCLEFEEQWIRVVYDEVRDRIALHVVYFGVWHKGGSDEEAADRFRDAVEGDEVCLADWPFHFQPHDREGDESGLSRLLREHVSVRRVGLFLDYRGRLSGGQIVSVEKVQELLSKLNDVFLSAVIPGALDENDNKVDEETRRLYHDAARRGHAWLRMRGQALELQCFCSQADLERLRRKMVEELFDDGLDGGLDFTALFATNPLALYREGTTFRLVLGDPAGPSRFRFGSTDEDPYEPNLVASARETFGWTLDDAVTPLLLEGELRSVPAVEEKWIRALGADDPASRDRAARALLESRPDPRELRRRETELAPDARRRLTELRRAIERREDLRAFALALPRPERVRLLLACADERAAIRLREELETLSSPPGHPPHDVRAFWSGWLNRRRQ
jgi:hypothetical protein